MTAKLAGAWCPVNGGEPGMDGPAGMASEAVVVAIEELLRRAPNFALRDIRLGPSFFVRGAERGFLDVMDSIL